MKTIANVLAAVAFAVLLEDCSSVPPTPPGYKPGEDPDMTLIKNRAVPRVCPPTPSLEPQTHRVYTWPSFSWMNVKLDLGKMDLDPKQVQQVTEALIALSWGRHDLCLNVKQAAYGDSDERYQAAWNAYGANTTKFDQFAMLALEHRPSAVQVGAVKPGVKTEVKPEGNPKDKQDAAKKLSEAIQKWLEAYGEPKKAVTKQQAAEAAEVSTPSTENKKQSLYRLSRELIQRPLRSNSEIGL